jgi:peptide/nickel transport system substrate-binding protein
MAAFLVRALDLTVAGPLGFVDDNGSVFERDIETLAAAGITKGCNPPANDRFCPTDPVMRDQLASFLGRALGLTPIVAAPFGGEVIVGVDQEPPTLNPLVPGGDNFIVTDIGQAYFGGVYDIDGETLELVPDLVTELPTVANGGVTVNDDGTMTVVYNIDPDAVWSDGVPVSGADFHFTLDVIMDPDHPIDRLPYESIISTTHSSKRYEVTLAQTTPGYESLFPILIPEHAVAGTDFVADWNDKMWPSAGPFVFDSWIPGDQLRLVRNERYWKSDPTSKRNLPFLDSVVFEFIPELADLVVALQSGAIDVMEPRPELDLVDDLAVSLGVIVDSAPGPVWEHLNFQFDPARLQRNPGSVNQHLDYRKALAYAIDRDAIAADLYGRWGEPLDSYVDTATPSFSQDAWLQYDHDLSVAQDYLESARTHFGVDAIQMVFSTTSNNDDRVRIAEMLVDMLGRDLGLEFENQLEDSQIFFGETLDRGLWDVGSWAWVGSPGYMGSIDLLEVFDPDAPPPDGANYYRWGSPGSSLVDASSGRFADILDEIEGEVDQRVLLPLLQETEQILADNVIIIPLYARPVFLAWRQGEVGGMAATGQSFTWNIAEWYRTDL